MQSVSSRIWTRVAVFISYDDENYTTGTSIFMKIVLFQTIQFMISSQFSCKYSLIMKNISVLSYSV